MRIAVIAPSRTLPEAAEHRLHEVLGDQDYASLSIRVHPQCYQEHGHFAGDDDARAAAFLEVANDPDVDAVWFARGGYGACRLLDRVLDGLEAAAAHKLYLGYSDGGYLLSMLFAHGIGRVVHGPMVADILRPGGEAAIKRVLDHFVGERSGLEPHSGSAAVAFNITVLASLCATPHLPSMEGRVLMIEEVAEHLYAIDRALFTAFASGKLKGLAGVRLGRVSDVPENDIDFGEGAENITKRWCNAHGTPYLGRADIGHDSQNKLVPFS